MTKLLLIPTHAHSVIRDLKIHYGELLLRLLRPWGTRLTTPFPPQTSNRLRFRCTATGCSASTCLYKNGYVRLYSTFIPQRLDQWQWFPSLLSILRLPEIRFASQQLLQRPASAATWIPTTKKNNTDKKLDFRGVTKQSNEVTENRVTRKNFERSKILKSFKNM